MQLSSRSRSVRRPLRASAMLALLLLFGLVGLRPPPTALAACGSATVVYNTAELNAAITAFNTTSPACDFVIQIGTDIDLTADITPIDNGGIGGTLTIQGSGNTVDGGGVYDLIVIDAVDVTIHDIELSDGDGHGVDIVNGHLRVAGSTIRNNDVNGIEGESSEVVVVNTILMNNGFSGLLVFGDGHSAEVINSTSYGHGISGIFTSSGTLKLTHVTIIGNRYGLESQGSNLTVNNSILADHVWGYDCAIQGGSFDFNYTLIEDSAAATECNFANGVDGNIIGQDPRLTWLDDHGGFTPTALPAVGSPVLNAGNNLLSLDEKGEQLTTDQRGDGFPRQLGAAVDMGATESSCAPIMAVGDEGQLRAAIDCFNATTTPGPYTIIYTDDISLTSGLPDFNNGTNGISLTIDGDGHTLDANGKDGNITIVDMQPAVIENITLINSSSDSILGIGTSLTVRNTTVRDTTTVGIHVVDGHLVVADSTLVDTLGNAVNVSSTFASTSLTLVNTTITGSGNSFAPAVTVNLADFVQLTQVTLVDNRNGLNVSSVGSLTINNSILAGSGNRPDCKSEFSPNSISYSLIQSDDASHPCGVVDGLNGNIVGLDKDPMLLPLGNYGGPTLTMPPYEVSGSGTTSPVIDAGNNSLVGIGLLYDQRGPGFPRIADGIVDMGAVEGAEVISCPSFPATVDDEDELNAAIFCYNLLTSPDDYTIHLGDDIELGVSSYPIDNPTTGVSLTIEGHGHHIDGDDEPYVRPLTIAPSTVVTLRDAEIIGGNATGYAGGIGGGIRNKGELTLERVSFIGNWAGSTGGAIFNDVEGELAIVDSRVENNDSGYRGGGIANFGFMTITDSTVESNTTENEDFASGGGISNEGKLILLRSTVAHNVVISEDSAYGGGILNEATLIVRDSTIMANAVESDYQARGAGIYSEIDSKGAVDNGFGMKVSLVNSTISGNSATGPGIARGGGLYAASLLCCGELEDPIEVTLTNTTVSDNSVASATDADGAGAYLALYDDESDFDIDIFNSILAGNTRNGTAAADCYSTGGPTMTFTSISSLYGDSDEGACGLALANPDGNGNRVGVDAKLGPLANNGGPTLTHMPADDSPAVNTGADDFALDENGNSLDADQRGFLPRAAGSAVDMGSVETEAEDPHAVDDAVYLSAVASGTTADGLTFDNSDILMWDGTAWSLAFDGSAALLAPNNKPKHNVNAFWMGDGEIIMGFAQNGRKVPGIGPKVDGMDLVRWDGSAFSLWFDGSDVGLTQKTPEKIDGLHVLPGSDAPDLFGSVTCLHYLLVSTQGPGAVAQFGGGVLKFGGEDVLGFCMTNLGDTTAGFWHLLLDGSAEGVKKNAIDSISLSADGQTLYLTTKGTFNVDAAIGGHSMVYAYDIATGVFSGPGFIAADNGLEVKVDGLQMN